MRFINFCAIVAIALFAFVVYVHSESCVQCTSANDPKCATDPENFLAKQCQNSSSICYTRVSNGNTIRGCASELDNVTASKCNNEMQCLICSFAEGCNRRIFPAHRIRCIQCEGNTTGDCALDVHAKATPCPIYKLGDKCYVRKDARNTTSSFQRGCLSTAQTKNICVKDGNCFICDGFGCNYIDVNDTQIPIARDSASLLGYSFSLLVAGILAARFF